MGDGPADGLGDLAREGFAQFFSRDGLGICEPCDGFGSGGFFSGGCALRGVGLYERVHSREYHRLWCRVVTTTYCGLLFDN